jgi:hypothetical protein
VNGKQVKACKSTEDLGSLTRSCGRAKEVLDIPSCCQDVFPLVIPNPPLEDDFVKSSVNSLNLNHT